MVAAIALGTTNSAFAFDSGGNPKNFPGDNTITWTGQGATNGTVDTVQCNAQDDPFGANQPYLLWILTTDGGSIQTDSTTPVLYLGGSGSGSYTESPPISANSVHFATPYFTPDSNLTAYATFNVLTTGNGSWNLVISHGCPGGGTPPADDLIVSKTATPSFTRTFTWGITKSVDQTQINIAPDGTATFNYTVSVTHDSGTDSNFAVNGTITVQNPNNFDVNGVSVSDAIDNGGNCTVAGGTGLTVAANSSTTVGYTCTFGSNPGNGTNTATATWPDIGSAHTSGTGTANYDFGPAIPTLVDDSVSVTDSLGGTLGTVSSGDPSPTTFTYPYSFKGDPPGTCTSHDNTATFTTDTTGTTGSASQSVKVCVGADLQVSKVVTPGFTRTFKWGISKSVDQTQINIAPNGTATFNYTVSVTHDSGTDSSFLATGSIYVKNPNDWESITANVTDTIDNGGTCTVTNGTGVVIAAGDTATLTYSCTFPSNPGTGTNTATATWDATAASTTNGSATGTAGYTFGNPTTVIDDSVTVTDTLGGTLGTVSSGDPSPTTFTYSYSFKGDPPGTCTSHDNTATFTTDTTGTTGSDGKTVKVCVGANLTVSKTATPSFDRTYAWTISKSVDKTLVEQVGGHATFNYTVSVSHDNGTDGNWQVNGTITVNNPNDWESITANVGDAIDNGGSCTVTPASVVVPAGGSNTAAYTCTYASAPSPSAFTNTATASWDKTAAYTSDSSATGTATGDFGTTSPNLVDECTNVTDTYAGTLGKACVGDANPKAFTYSRTVPVPANGCQTYNNTATFTTNDTGTTGNASQSVKVCGPAATGALTIGFWKNTNGQGLITGYCGSGTTGLAYYLSHLGGGLTGPFADAAGKSCSQLASYVQGILNSASASNMNAMLRAQMLGTALDVYFSGPGWTSTKSGSNKPPSNFLSHNNLGTFNMDTTAVCPMVDNTSAGTAMCGNNKPATNAVASGAVPSSPMSMQAILDYASTTPSPFNGSTSAPAWFGTNRTLQEVLKNIFDQFNNQLAFGSF